MKLFRLSVFIYLVVSSFSATAAFAKAETDTSRTTAVTVGLHSSYGFIIPHSSSIKEVASTNPWGIEADISLHFTGKKAWQYLQGYPRLGASVAIYDFNNPEVLGKSYSLLFFAEPFLSAHKKFSLSFRLGGGVAYMSNPFHPETNPYNLFYSTAVSFPLVAGIMGNYRLNKHILLRAGATYNHISNGGIQQPNKGINYPMLSAGVNYAIRPADFPERQATAGSPGSKQRLYMISLNGAAKDSHGSNSRKLPVVGLTALASQKVGRLTAFRAGFEWIADFSLREELKKKEENKDFQRGALLAGPALLIGRVHLNLQLGVYVYTPSPAKDPVYQRYGIEYHTPGRLFFGVNLKAHRHVADFLDARVGLHF